jgi:hypothetical protein
LSLPTQAEVDRLKRDIKKLRDYLKTSVQERKLLLRKIGTLNERLSKADNGDCSLCREKMLCSMTTEGHATAPRYLLLRIANLQQRLANSCEDSDLLRSQLETIVETLDPLAEMNYVPRELVGSTLMAIERSKTVSKFVSRAPTPLVVESVFKEDEEAEQDPQRWKRLSTGSVSSLPDPSMLDFGDLARPRLAISDADQRSFDMERKVALIDLMEEKILDKDSVIREQSSLLDEYRVEMGKLREELHYDESKGNSSLERRLRQRRFKGLATPQSRRRATSSTTLVTASNTANEKEAAAPAVLRNVAIALSDGDDSWSEPDVNAARKRMGLSTAAHLMSTAEKKVQDSSETEAEKKRKYCTLRNERNPMYIYIA